MDEIDNAEGDRYIWKVLADGGRTVLHVSAPSLRAAVYRAMKLITDSDDRLGSIECIAQLDVLLDK